ncbi:glycosyltransferase 87 family protein [Kitasatospora sp. MY 5-36]|uniref:glycosyltransferase 87 family protein n=1 Tax=Kitasatospora sp. MY 5-36 TaxID=1678027 RepID=UPI0007C7E557|nr:glycosyltransferase 87 family protein [Kitasatospora sp. MY 5-36]
MSAPRLLTHRTVSTTASEPGAWWAHRLPPVVAWTLCALFAGGLGLASTLGPHRVWGATAAGGYLAAALLSGLGQGVWRRRAVRVAAAGSVLVPLVLLVLRGQGQLELDVVQRSGERLLSTGVPYLDRPAALADYNPYLPGMAVFGLPHALLGDVVAGDARWWFTLSFLAVTAVSARITAGRRGSVGLAALAAFPAVALPLAVGGVDLPVSALMCLALALAGTGRPGGTGLALGAAASLKWTAWPLVPVALVLLATVRGRSAALRALAVTVAAAGTVVIPSVLATPGALLEHTVLFPTGAGVTASPADSPLPGHLLAAHVPGGRALALALLALAAAAVGTSLLTHPPRTVVAASDRLALGLALAICLAPATRFGYLVVPFVLVGWVRLRPDSLDPGDRMRTVAVPRQHPTGRHAPRRRLRWTHALLRRLGRRA